MTPGRRARGGTPLATTCPGDGTTMERNDSWTLLEERLRVRRPRGRRGMEWTEARRIVLRERAGREVAPPVEVPALSAGSPP
jgi:hypothetical protein